VKVGGHPMESVSHGLWKESGEDCQSLSKTCLVWKILRTPLPVVDKE
jgi:hypothetical protein